MTDRGVIFSAAMVCAIDQDRKTQTRRLASSPLRRCVAGDRLWVRETCRAIELEGGSDCVEYRATMDREDDEVLIENSLEASERWGALSIYGRGRDFREREAGGLAGPWVPAIHMPRWASRLTLIVEAVRVEPLQAITNEDCIAEGIPVHCNKNAPRTGPVIDDLARRCGLISHYGAEYRRLWQSLHKAEGQRWQDNPTVVALTFRVVKSNIDRMPG